MSPTAPFILPDLPGSVSFIDPKTHEVALSRMELPSFGMITLLRTSRVAALAPNGQLKGDIVSPVEKRLQSTKGDSSCLGCLGSAV